MSTQKGTRTSPVAYLALKEKKTVRTLLHLYLFSTVYPSNLLPIITTLILFVYVLCTSYRSP